MLLDALWHTDQMCSLRPTPSNLTRHSVGGFTLIEVMVVVALIAILAALAAPSWTQMQVRSSIRAFVNDYTMSLHLARSEAVRLNSPVTVCPSNNGLNCTNSELEDGWIVSIGLPADAAPRIIQDFNARTNVRTGFTTPNRWITFLPNGQPSGMPIYTIRACPRLAGMDALSRNIAVNQSGRTRVDAPGACQIP